MLYLTGNGRYIKPCILTTGNGPNDLGGDYTGDGWNIFRRLLHFVVSKHRNIDI
jgi:hypothetical protein